MTVCSRALVFMKGLCVLIEREYKPGKLFLPQKKKSRCQALGGGGMGWGRLSQPEKREARSENLRFLGSLLGTCRSAIGQFFPCS